MGRALIGDAYDAFYQDPDEPHELQFALTTAGLPSEDPVPHLKRRLGESMHEGHHREVYHRVLHFAEQLKEVEKPLRRVPKQKQFGSVQELQAAYQHLDAPLEQFYTAAKRLHLLDITAEQPEGEALADELGESEDSTWGRRRSNEEKKKAKAGKGTGSSKKDAGKGTGSSKKGAGVCKGKTVFDAPQCSLISTGGACLAKKSLAGTPMCAWANVDTKTRRRRYGLTGMISHNLGVMLSAGKKGLGMVFKLLRMCTVKFLQMIGMFMKAFVTKIAKMFTKIPGMGKIAKMIHDCSNHLQVSGRIKCGAGQLGPPDKNGHQTCANGGGSGQNWLWTERVNTRRPAHEWLNHLPDSSECHDQKSSTPGEAPSDTAALAKPKACYGPHMAAGAYGTKSAKHYSAAHDNTSPMYRGPPGKFDGYKWVTGTIHNAPQNQKGFAYCADRYFNANHGGGHSYGTYKTKQENEFWRKFDYEKYRQACEYDNRCILYNLNSYGNHQGFFRCVPRAHAEDPRFAEISGYKQRNSKPHDDGRTFVKGKVLRAQTAAAMWQRPAQPYLGGRNMKKQWIAPAKGDDENNARAHKLMGDTCIHYGWNSTFQEEKEGYLPPTAVRCLSQQFRVFTDEATFGVCLGFSPSRAGKMISDMLLKPILKLLPGGLDTYLGPAFYDLVGKFLGKKLITTLQGLPYYLGFVFRSICYLFGDFYNIQWANIIGGFHPDFNIDTKMGAVDVSHDASQDRMDRVYRGKARCKSAVTTGCPAAIPVRAGFVYGERSGDVTGSAYDTLYGGREKIKVHSTTVKAAYSKHSMCLKVPLCDTKLADSRKGSMYSADPKIGSLDCSGHGTCMWNMENGNHCKCDAGYSFYERCGRCCTKGTPMASCCDGSSATTEGEKKREITPKLLGIIGTLVGDEVKRACGKSSNVSMAELGMAAEKGDSTASAVTHGSKPAGQSSEKLAEDTLLQTGEDDALGAADDETRSSVGSFKDDQKKGGLSLYGHQYVSKRCNRLNKSKCKKKPGCNWSMVSGDDDLPMSDPWVSREKCVDAASWRCNTRKNFVDCLAHNKYGPSAVNWKFDGLCSSVIFNEKPKKKKLCSKGIRKREACDSNQDCPIFKGGGHAACKIYSAVEGCQVLAQQRCSALGYGVIMQHV